MRTLNPTSMLVVLALALTAGCGKPTSQSGPGPSRPAAVIVEPVAVERTRTRLEAVGTSRALRSVEVFPVTSGEVVAVNFEPGEKVTAGSTLVELDSREQALTLKLAEVRLADAERLLSRYRRSESSGAVLPTVVDEAETAVEAARIELEQARLALDYRSIDAPFDGHVGVTEVDRGDRIGPATLVTTLDDRTDILVSFNVPEAFVGELNDGDEVTLLPWHQSGDGRPGQVVDVSSRIDSQTRTFVVRARVENSDDQLRPGMSFRVRADLAGQRFPVVTETGVQWGADGAYVWVVRNGRAHRIPVEVVQRREGRVLIRGDIAPGTNVVVEGVQGLREGSEVDYLEQVSSALEGAELVGAAD